jgi:hypothetical protein
MAEWLNGDPGAGEGRNHAATGVSAATASERNIVVVGRVDGADVSGGFGRLLIGVAIA